MGHLLRVGQEGGPPHRIEMLCAQPDSNLQDAGYQFAVNEIIRGVDAVSGLKAGPASPGWVAVECDSPHMAFWLCDALKAENVEARADGMLLFLPVGTHYTLAGEIKSVITVVAKTTHYWRAHVPAGTKNAMQLIDQIERLQARVQGWLRRLAK